MPAATAGTAPPCDRYAPEPHSTLHLIPPPVLATAAATPPLPPPPALQRPVLFVHGYNSRKRIWDDVVRYLTKNSHNHFGGLIDEGSPGGRLDPQGNLFELKLSKPWNSADANAAELSDALERVAKLTGATKIDVVTHSMGALDARDYVQLGGTRIGRLVMVSPPNHGSIQADTELYLRDHLGIPTLPPNNDPGVRAALLDLRVDLPPEQNHGLVNNPFLHTLNGHWTEQRGHLMDADIIVGGGVPTYNPDGSITTMGDGAVTWQSSALPGISLDAYYNPVHDLHFRILKDPRVAVDIGRFLADP